MAKVRILKNGNIITPFKILNNSSLIIEDGIISGIINSDIDFSNKSGIDIFDVSGLFITPGLIDIHTHGGGGQDCINGDIRTISNFKLKQGVTGYLPTIIASPMESILDSIDRIFKVKNSNEIFNTQIMGVHLEGIYLNPSFRGAQPLEYLRKPDLKECSDIINRIPGFVKIMTISPEVDGCLDIIGFLSKMNVIPSVGHSDASVDIIERSINLGLKHATHIFNAMGRQPQIEHGVYNPGLEDILLIKDEINCEIIADTAYVHPVMMNLLLKIKQPSRVLLVSDSMGVAGLPNGEYDIGIEKIILKNEVARLTDGRLTGSVLTMNKAIGNIMKITGIGICDAVRMASYNQAVVLGIESKKGTLDIGKDADIAVLDCNLNTVHTFINGKLVYSQKENVFK
ncbi:MAG: N-acetylglucosamine-6-phosphate deacetylase [Actinobacteria bacterium]|nr:N-acetylglucosamine-6-phosphate deacetylase [Actinomycetota bacterium]